MTVRPERPLTRGDVLTARQLTDPEDEGYLLPDTDAETVLRWARAGSIPSRKRGQKVFFLRHEIEEWLIGDGNRAMPSEAA